jgi:Ca2+-binding RTX toxin-like protein
VKNFIRLKKPRGVWLAAVSVAAALAGTAAIVPGQATGAPVLKAHKGSHVRTGPKFQRPRLRHGLLTIVGTRASDKIALRLQAHQPGILQVDVGDNGTADFRFKRKKIARIAVDARAGNDLVRIAEGHGVFTDKIRTRIDGGAGNDTLAGGSGAETLLGGDGNDSIDGNRGSDLVLMGAGDDTFVWDAGDGSDVVEGEAGTDTMRFNGADVAERIDLSTSGGRVRLVRDVGNVTMDTAGLERIDVEALGGNDVLSAAALVAQPIALTLNGGAGDDVLAGGQGVDTLLGGDGNDTIDGNAGNDRARMGAGDDTFVWDPGDGSDVVEGEAGADTMRFNGANAAERVDLSANGGRLRFFRDVGNITMDTAGVEAVEFNALGGADTVTVNDLKGTDVTSVSADLAAAGGIGDGQPDRVVVNGTNGDDSIAVTGDAGGVKVSGLAATVAILHPEVANDRLEINTLDGRDVVDASGLAAGAIQLVVDGGAGDDTLAGSQGVDRLLGGDGNDSIDGNKDNDTALLGAGDDTFVWDPGDGSDVVEGEAGADTMRFNGADVSDRVALVADGNRLKFFRGPGNVTMDTAGVERIDFNALGGPDSITVGDLTGTDVGAVNLDLASTLGGGQGNGQADHVVVEGTNDGDRIRVNSDASGVVLAGLRAVVAIRHQEPADELAVDGLGGNDDISAPTLAAQAIALTLDGGAGDDSLFGGLGKDILLGGDGNDSLDGFRGNDRALMGAGDDTFFWDPGDGSDTVEGEDGTDTMSFIGANIGERIDVSANGNRVRFSRDIGNVTMDTAGVDQIDFEALAGSDLVTVNDLTGTDLRTLQLDLDGAAPGGGDGEPDRVVVNGTNGDDAIRVFDDAQGVNVKGLAPLVEILHPEGANDRLDINTLDGSDTVDSSGLAAGTIQLFVDGVRLP